MGLKQKTRSNMKLTGAKLHSLGTETPLGGSSDASLCGRISLPSLGALQ